MNILLTNDDGYFAPGIRTLAKRLSSEHNVVVVAPKEERSGYAHMVNFFSGISYAKVDMEDGIETYAVNGSPADCVIFAVKYLYSSVKFDAVLSGINSVRNVGSDIMYSGTFGAAQEGTFHKIPSIAVSLRTRRVDDYADSAEFVALNLSELLKYAGENVTINVNIPFVKKEDIKGVRVAPVAYRPYNENYVCKKDANGVDFYYVDGRPNPDHEYDPLGDCYLSDNGYITITPVQMISTDTETLAAMRGAEFKL